MDPPMSMSLETIATQGDQTPCVGNDPHCTWVMGPGCDPCPSEAEYDDVCECMTWWAFYAYDQKTSQDRRRGEKIAWVVDNVSPCSQGL